MSLHIHAPKGQYFAQVRRPYRRLWESVGEPFDCGHEAEIAAIEGMTKEHKKARVLFCAEWYDPIVVMEASR